MKFSQLLALATCLAGLSTAAPAAEPEPVEDAATCTYVLKKPEPKGYYCNAGGLVATPSFLGTPFPSSYEKCKDTCLGNKKCISFLYRIIDGNTLGLCAPYTDVLTKQTYILIGDHLGNIYYNRHCFEKKC